MPNERSVTKPDEDSALIRRQLLIGLLRLLLRPKTDLDRGMMERNRARSLNLC
jgi:hypothetical protein